MRCQTRITRTRWQVNHRVVNARRIKTDAIVATHPFDIANVMTVQRNDAVQPVFARDSSISNLSAAQNLLPHQRDENRVFYVMIKSITIGNVFECHAASPAQNVSIASF